MKKNLLRVYVWNDGAKNVAAVRRAKMKHFSAKRYLKPRFYTLTGCSARRLAKALTRNRGDFVLWPDMTGSIGYTAERR